MRRRYVPPHFHRELQRRFRRLTQGNKTVGEYFDEFEHLRNRLEMDESEEGLMAQFLDGLQEPIARKVERQPYHDLGELFHLAVQVEQSNRRKASTTLRPKTNWNAGSRPYDRTATNGDQRFKGKIATNPAPKLNPTAPRTASTAPPQRSSEITCFKCKGRGHMSRECPNQRTMVLTASGDYESDDEAEEVAIATNQQSDEDVEYADSGDLLMIRRVLSSRLEPEEIEQRENIFHSKCTILGKVCSLIIDGGSCTNAASKYMVEKLGLPVTKHPRPYRLRWLNNKTELYISDQVRVSFSIGRYQDQVLCDVVPMSAGHLLLGRPWQFDRETTHNGRTNFYSFVHEKRRFNLAPMSPLEVREMQSKMAKDQHARKENFLVNVADVRKAVQTEGSQVVLLVYKELLSATSAEDTLPEEVKTLLERYADVFPDDIPAGLPPIRGIEHNIDFIPGAQLPNRPAYRVNPEEAKELERQVQDLMAQGYVRESLSPCAVPVLLVPKKDGSWRMCVDCRAINNITIKYRHPIPRLDDMLDELSGAAIFSKIDLKSGYHQVQMREGDE